MVVVNGSNTVSFIAELHHLLFVCPAISGSPFFECSHIDKLRFRQIEFVTHFFQYASELTQFPHIGKVIVHIYIFSDYLFDVVFLNEGHKCISEILVLFVIILSFGFCEIPSTDLM